MIETMSLQPCSTYTGFQFAPGLHSRCWGSLLCGLRPTHLKEHLPSEPTHLLWSSLKALSWLPPLSEEFLLSLGTWTLECTPCGYLPICLYCHLPTVSEDFWNFICYVISNYDWPSSLLLVLLICVLIDFLFILNVAFDCSNVLLFLCKLPWEP